MIKSGLQISPRWKEREREMLTYKVGEHGSGNDAPMQTLGDQPRPLNQQPQEPSHQHNPNRHQRHQPFTFIQLVTKKYTLLVNVKCNRIGC